MHLTSSCNQCKPRVLPCPFKASPLRRQNKAPLYPPHCHESSVQVCFFYFVNSVRDGIWAEPVWFCHPFGGVPTIQRSAKQRGKEQYIHFKNAFCPCQQSETPPHSHPQSRAAGPESEVETVKNFAEEIAIIYGLTGLVQYHKVYLRLNYWQK